jgi:hypothetical protein
VDVIPAGVRHDLVTFGELRYVGTDLFHDTGDVPTGDDGKHHVHQLVQAPGHQLPVDGIDRGAAYPDQNFTRADLRRRPAGYRQHLQAAVRLVGDCLHRARVGVVG